MDLLQAINLLFHFRISTSAQPKQIKFDGLYQMVTKGQEKNASNIKCYGFSTTNQCTILLPNLNFSSTTAQPQQIKFDGLYQMVTKGQEKNASNIKCYGSSSTNHFTPESQLQRNHNK